MSALRTSVVLSALIAVSVATNSHAQQSGSGFLFGAPAGAFALRGGWAIASARSDLFSFNTELLTLERSDFSSPAGDADLAFNVNSRTQIVAGVSVAMRNKRSEFRGFIDNENLPIEQTTNFLRVPVTLSVKRYLTSTGRSIGKFAWIPAKFAPYVGAGVGGMFYRFRQDGDFVDFEDMGVFPDHYESSGWTPTANGQAGVDYSLNPRFGLTAEARYVWAKAALSRDFQQFDKLDLSGLSTSIGFTVRY